MIPYDQLPDTTRLWIYPSSRAFSVDEIHRLTPKLALFAQEWTAHSRQLTAYAGIQHDRFLILAVDESQAGASGCSIDSSVHFVQQIGREFSVDFFNRMLFFVQTPTGWVTYDRDAFATAYAQKSLTDDSLVADPLVKTKGEAREKFIRRLGDSWHARFV